jgi:hypothetical protein
MNPAAPAPPTPAGLTNDEWRLIRLVRCSGEFMIGALLIDVSRKLLARYPIDRLPRDPDKAKAEAAEEMEWELEDRLRRTMPYDSNLTDIRNYDWPLIEEAWGEGDDFVDALLGSSNDDDSLADQLVDSYLKGAEEYGVPLAVGFGATDEEMREDLMLEAKAMILGWRMKIVEVLESRSGERSLQHD